jgi:Protein of unknown function (DUF3617)
MRKIIPLGILCLWASGLWAGGKVKPLNVKTGLWQTTSTTTVTGSMGIPPEMAAKLTPAQRAGFEAAMKKQASGVPRTRTYKSCLTEKNLTEDPFADKNDKFKCQETVIQSTGTELEVREACTDSRSKSDVHLVLHASSSEHVTGSGNVVVTMGGHTMHSVKKMDSKWVGASCPAGTH